MADKIKIGQLWKSKKDSSGENILRIVSIMNRVEMQKAGAGINPIEATTDCGCGGSHFYKEENIIENFDLMPEEESALMKLKE